jgi:hypothetical protein
MAELRTFVYLDILQPQVASFVTTIAKGYLPIEEQAALFVEIAPGIDINRAMDFALKATEVRPAMMIVERAYGLLEVHHFNQGEIRAAGRAILDGLGFEESDRLTPRILTTQIITGIDAHHTMLINRIKHGQMILKGETLYILEVHPAGYAMFAANEAEKAAPINILEVRAFGAFGRVYLGGHEAEILEAANAAIARIEAIQGRPNVEGEKYM